MGTATAVLGSAPTAVPGSAPAAALQAAARRQLQVNDTSARLLAQSRQRAAHLEQLQRVLSHAALGGQRQPQRVTRLQLRRLDDCGGAGRQGGRTAGGAAGGGGGGDPLQHGSAASAPQPSLTGGGAAVVKAAGGLQALDAAWPPCRSAAGLLDAAGRWPQRPGRRGCAGSTRRCLPRLLQLHIGRACLPLARRRPLPGPALNTSVLAGTGSRNCARTGPSAALCCTCPGHPWHPRVPRALLPPAHQFP